MDKQAREETQPHHEELERLEEHTEHDEKALLEALNDDDFDPDDVIKPEQDIALVAGKQSARLLLGVIEKTIKTLKQPSFKFEPEEIENMAEATAPLLVKYKGELPPWLAEYKEEITFVVAAGALGYSSIQKIKALNTLDKAKETEKKEKENTTPKPINKDCEESTSVD